MWQVDEYGVLRYTDFDLLPDGSPNPEWANAWNFDVDPDDPTGLNEALAREYPEAWLGGLFIGAALGVVGALASSLIACAASFANLVEWWRKGREGG